MTRVLATLVITISLCWCRADYTTTYVKDSTARIKLKQGTLQGVVVAFRTNRNLQPVEQYKGIPYAAPPVGELRFMPPGSAPNFLNKALFAKDFGPVCPQKFPDTEQMTPERRAEFFRLQRFLQNQNEDCLYLNVYVPYRDDPWARKNYPVMVFIHGESFEWNSGNPYDGSILAAYGKVIVVTLNYRLGVLGFLKAGTEEHSRSNFGLVDQIAALLWVKENIAAFGGNPNSVTLFAHGTGAVCANLLMLSPMVQQEHNTTLFQRAILLGGSALSDWALADNPLYVTYQVAQELNCQTQDDFAACLRKKRLEEIMAARPRTYAYRTRFGPVVDALVVPSDPKKLMTTYSDIFRRFDLMYGVAELESIHMLAPDALKLGMLERDRDQELRRYLELRCERKPELCLTRTLEEYVLLTDFEDKTYGYTGHEPDRASVARDALLDILSDARTVAPMVQMGKYHAALNPRSYFYVFTHRTLSKKYIRDKSFTGEELPYVFGVPLVGNRFHFTDHYTEKERLFSEIVMTYFSNFAYTGNPKIPRKNEYYTLGIEDWIKFDVDWPPFDLENQQYLRLAIPPYRMNYYRYDKMLYWNEIFPELTNTTSVTPVAKKPMPKPAKNPPPWILTHPPGASDSFMDKFENFHKPYVPTQGIIRITGTSSPDNIVGNVVYGTVVKSPGQPGPDNESKGISTTVTIAMSSIFLISNLCLFLVLYLTCYRKKKFKCSAPKSEEAPAAEEDENDANIMDGCNLMKIVSKSERSDDTYEPVKSSRSGRYKVPRQMSSSTIDAHAKVRDWIANEIVYRYSPRFLRRPRRTSDTKIQVDNNSTLGQSPTRPVSPTEIRNNVARPPLVKSSSIPIQKKKVEKVSVAIDATPSGRGPSVLAQQPIELTKSLDRPNFDPPLRRSLTLEDFSVIQPAQKQELRKSTTSINLKFPAPEEPTVIRIEHAHSKSDPVQDFSSVRKLRTFDPNSDVNVTSLDEVRKVPLTPEESLMTIKRRNFPKVLPDYPTREALAKKRRSMPVSNHMFSPIPEIPGQMQTAIGRTFGKFPPAPPLRTTSTLTRKVTNQQPPVCQSAPMLAQEPPPSPEPEVTCNNLYFGPLIPKLAKTELSSSDGSKLNTQPIYEKLRAGASDRNLGRSGAKTIITTDPNNPIKKAEPKVIIKPTMTRNLSDPKKHIPRVMVHDNLSEDDKAKPSQIPTPKPSKESSSSESTPSEESDTGTVVKKL